MTVDTRRPVDLAGKRPATTVTAPPAPTYPAERGTNGRWIPAFVFAGLPALFLIAALAGYLHAN